MAVYTDVSFEELESFLAGYDIGVPLTFKGIAEGVGRIVVDLAKVTFIDSTALGVVVGGVKGIRAHGGSLDIICRDENIRRIFEITGLDRILGMYGSREEALGAAK